MGTADRAVLFAGTTVVIALLGLFVMQQRLLNAMAVAAGVTVLMTMITAVTLLPALLLSVAAAYGVLTAVVQWGWAGRLLGFPTDMPVATWVPMIMFPILFGLSMDYEVFLISRIREIYEQGVESRQAVALGLARTARVITAAAATMVMVLLSVLLGADVAVKQLGLGLGVAVLIDATVVRLVLVPALMELFGTANWWLPGWRGRRPGRSVGVGGAVRKQARQRTIRVTTSPARTARSAPSSASVPRAGAHRRQPGRFRTPCGRHLGRSPWWRSGRPG